MLRSKMQSKLWAKAVRAAAWAKLSQAQKDNAWKKAKRLEEKEIRKKGDFFARASVAATTGVSYDRAWLRWKLFARARGAAVLPPDERVVEAFLILVLAPKKSVAVIDAFSAAMNWFCGRAGLETPLSGRKLSLIVRGMKCEFKTAVRPRLPFTRKHVRRFMDAARRSESLKTWRAAVILALSFQEFLRFSEAAFLRLEDLEVDKDGVHFRVKKAKNHRTGFEGCVPVRRDNPYCVGNFVLEFMEKWVKWSPGMSGALCSKIVDAGKRFSLKQCSYSVLHNACKDIIVEVGLDPNLYSTHSAKRGGASAAAAAGLSSAEITALGRWRSAKTGVLYVHGTRSFRRSLCERFST
jgi:hypothetical protein